VIAASSHILFFNQKFVGSVCRLNAGIWPLTDTYTYPTTNNRLQSIALGSGGIRSFTYDAAGNVTYDNRSGQGFGYTYDNAGRMASFSLNGVVQAEYAYNQLGQQITRRLT
jgi:YD repeat-containing protein